MIYGSAPDPFFIHRIKEIQEIGENKTRMEIFSDFPAFPSAFSFRSQHSYVYHCFKY